MDSVEFVAMNTHIVLAAEGTADRLTHGFERTRAFISDREAQFTRFQETSELSALNRSAGMWFNASPELYAVVQEAYALHLETEGLFNPAVLRALERVGYDVSMDAVRARTDSYRDPARVQGAVPTLARTESVAADFTHVSFHAAQRAIWMPEGMRIDLGGIAKGWIAEHAAHVLADYTESCAVNAGGDLFTIGLPQGTDWWEVEIENPNDAAGTIAVVRAPAGAVATSSVTKRKWKQDSAERHHLIDPRTGMPADSDWLSVTVLAPHAAVAEVYAKALLIAGAQDAGRISSKRDDVNYIAVHRDGTLWGSERAGEFLDGTIGSN